MVKKQTKKKFKKLIVKKSKKNVNALGVCLDGGMFWGNVMFWGNSNILRWIQLFG